jgi:UPF0755 protein
MIKKILFIVFVLPALLLIGGGIWLYYAILKPMASGVKLDIAAGSTMAQIATKLKEQGAIKSELAFKLYAKYSGLAGKVQAGNYQLPAGLTLPELLKKLTEGKTLIAEKQILIKEGMTNKAIEEYLKANNLITDGSFLGLATTLTANLPAELKAKYTFLSEVPTKVDLEGFLFPDTYRLFQKDNGAVLVDKMLANFDSKVTPEMRAEIKRQGKNLYQIMVMASIIEKEVRSTEDMKIVSGIFWDRLKAGQRLQSCATLAYILGVNKPQYSLEDTQIDSPFNTYRIDGLPPTPIGNPGIRAIEAAIYPDTRGYRFFLSDPATGKTIWAKTFDEHIKNKALYLK